MDRIWLLLAAGMMCRPASFAQGQPAVMRLQRAGSLAADPGGREIAVGMRATLMRFQQAGSLAAGPGNEIRFRMPAPVTGLPFSATVTTHTTQSKPDGTYVSRTMTMVQYRDSDGRTRTEMGESTGASPEPVKLVTIRDPVAGVSYTIDPAKKTVVALSAVMIVNRTAAGTGGGDPGNSALAWTSYAAAMLQRLQEAGQTLWTMLTVKKDPNHIVEDLGTLTVNGVAARGTRTTNVVPARAIGNDREFRSISESWFSPDLQLVVKSISTDQRFGTTTYELTNINRQPPAPSLFQPPAGYNLRTLFESAGIASGSARK